MKFVKDNLAMVVCGAVALLSAVAAWYLWGPARAPLRSDMAARYDHRNTIQEIANTELALPGKVTVDGQPLTTQKGPPSEGYVELKTDAIQKINAMKDKVQEESKTANMLGRIDSKNVPILPLPTTPLPPWGKPMPNYLPKLKTGIDPMVFKETYMSQFVGWTSLLATGDLKELELKQTVPPKQDDVKADYDALVARRAAAAPPPTPGSPPPVSTAALDAKMLEDMMRQAVYSRAADLRMYVEPNAYQIRNWSFSPDPPNDQQVFEAFIDSWCQSDVVKAIIAVNNEAIGSPTERSVAKSAVKRLIHITLGSSARTRTTGAALSQAMAQDPGPLFYTTQAAIASNNPNSAALRPGPLVDPTTGAMSAAQVEPNKIDYSLSMTGRASAGVYDVVLMSIWMDIDPKYLNSFIDKLYRQNMGYTVINLQCKTVNPLERVSNGYLYGETQVVEAQILVEAIFFRGWTEPLMPDGTRVLLGMPAAATQPQTP